MSTTAGSIVVDLLARTGAFETDMDRAAKMAKRRAEAIANAFDAMRSVIVASSAAAGGAMLLMVNNMMDSAKEITQLSQISGASVEEFQRMAVAAATVGISQEKLSDQLKDFREKVGEFVSSGGGGMKDFFQQIAPRIGITAEAFANLSGPQALQLYVSSLEKAGVSQEQMSFYLENMASDTTALIPLLADGGAKMAALGAAADSTGQIMSANLIAATKMLADEQERLNGLLAGARNILGAELIPVLIQGSREMFGFGQQSEAVRIIASGLATVFETVAVLGINVKYVITQVGNEIGGLAAQAAAVAQLQFKQAAAIGDIMKSDAAKARAEVDAASDRILNARKQFQQSMIGPPQPAKLGGAFVPVAPVKVKPVKAARAPGMSDAEREQQRLMQEGARVFDQTRTAAEKLGIEFDRLDKLRTVGAINQDTYNRAVFDAQAQFDDLIEKTSEFGKAQARVNDLIGATALKQQIDDYLLLADAMNRGVISQEQFATGMERIGMLSNEQEAGSYWEKWLQAAEGALGNFDELSSDVIEDFASNFGDAFEKMVFDSESLGDAIQQLAEGMARSMVNALGEMAAQWLAYQAVQMLVGQSTAAGGAMAQTMNAMASQQMAALNAFAATAAIPIVGPAMAPAAAAAALAATSPMVATIAALSTSAIAGARLGGGPVGSGHSYLVGERGPELFTPSTAGRILPNSALGSSGAQPANIRIVNAFDSSVIGDYMGSDTGEQLVLNAVKRNAGIIRQVVAR